MTIFKSNFRFRWLVDNEDGKIDDWSPCLGNAEYGVNITQPISLIPPSTGEKGTTEYTLTCVSVQYFDQADNGTLGDFYGTANRADIHIIVTEEKDMGHNTTVSKKIGKKILYFIISFILDLSIPCSYLPFHFQNISLPWLIILIVVCLLLLLFLLLLLWTYCTKTLCFASKDHNNNVKGSQGRNGGRNKGKPNQKPSEGLQGRDIHLVQNNEGKNHQNRNDNKFQELRVINQYDNNQQDPRQGRDSYRYDDSGFSNRQDYRNYNQHPIQV